MSDVAIRAEGLSKQYCIGSAPEYSTFRDTLAASITGPINAIRSALGRHSRPEEEERGRFWSLEDVSFEISRGSVVGIIGRNGAGKSTLLKILARITEPTRGRAEIHGRVGSLLEVGTGFHQELSGRENVYLSGAILGMGRSEINRKLDEIVEFSEVERFIDTPVKHYSSGMYLRLAFSVAAHLEPEILLVDEVLAVGDMAFQNKCLGKMENVAAHGRTVLFVSHNLGVVKDLCQTSLVLSSGRLAFSGPVHEGLMYYTRSALSPDQVSSASGTGWKSLGIDEHPEGTATTVHSGDPFRVHGHLRIAEELLVGRLICIIEDAAGNLIVHPSLEKIEERTDLAPGNYRFEVAFPGLWLSPGMYTVYFKFLGRTAAGGDARHISSALCLDVPGRTEGKTRRILAPPVDWRMEVVPDVRPAAQRVLA